MKKIAALIAAIPCVLGLYFLSGGFASAPNRSTPLGAYRNPIDMLLAVAPGWVARRYRLRDPCEGERIDACVAMTEPQTFSGVWLNYEPGLANFFPGETAIRLGGCGAPAHLTFKSQADEERHWAYDHAHGPFFGGELITFVGRKTKYKGDYPGSAQEDYLIDRVTAYRPLPGMMMPACPL